MLAAVVAGGAMLTLGVVQTAVAAPYVIQTLGRNVVTYTSSTARWTASAQGEVIDKEGSGKIEPNALRGRAAVQEQGTTAIRRVRIYDVYLQRYVNGAWQTVARNATDKVDERAQAYAVSYTPPTRRLCWIDKSLRRTYRVVNSHGIRRSNGVVVNKTTTSKSFSTYALDDDPACPRGLLTAYVAGVPGQIALNDPQAVQVDFSYYSTLGAAAENVVARMNFGDGLVVQDAPAAMALDESTPDPNDYRQSIGTVQDGWWLAQDDWTIVGTDLGSQSIAASITTTSARMEVQNSSETTEVLDSNEADLSLGASVVDGEQRHAGDPVTYRIEVANLGPMAAHSVKVAGGWPAQLGNLESATVEPAPLGEDPCQVEGEYVNCYLPDLALGESAVVTLTTHIDADAPVGAIDNNFVVERWEPDSNWENEQGEAIIQVIE
jgi:hypothetical protein